SMPGEPMGMPGTANPIAFGFSLSKRRMSPAGTCPSIAYPATTAVWQEPSFCGIPTRARAFVLPLSLTVTRKPLSCMCLTQSLQQPQVGLFQTSTDGIDACAATQPGKPVTNAPRARAGIVTIARRNFFIGCSTQAEVE